MPVDLDHVFAVGRELVLDEHAAARAERQPLDVASSATCRSARRTPSASACVTLPMARRLILPAADRYASMSAGDIVSVPAMLSNPCVESSDGRNLVASTSSASRSRIAFAYSARLSRCRPGGGRCGDRAAIELVLQPARPARRASPDPAAASPPAASSRPGASGPLFPPSPRCRRARQIQPVQLQVRCVDFAL